MVRQPAKNTIKSLVENIITTKYGVESRENKENKGGNGNEITTTMGNENGNDSDNETDNSSNNDN